MQFPKVVEPVIQFTSPLIKVPLLDTVESAELLSDAQLMHTIETKTTNKAKIFNFFMLTPWVELLFR